MRYKNIKTGAIIDSPCVIKGENWIEEIKNEVEEVQEEAIEDEAIEGVEEIEEVKKPVKATTKTKAKE